MAAPGWPLHSFSRHLGGGTVPFQIMEPREGSTTNESRALFCCPRPGPPAFPKDNKTPFSRLMQKQGSRRGAAGTAQPLPGAAGGTNRSSRNEPRIPAPAGSPGPEPAAARWLLVQGPVRAALLALEPGAGQGRRSPPAHPDLSPSDKRCL